MKDSTIYCAIVALFACAALFGAHLATPSVPETPEIEEYLEYNPPLPGMFFTSESVVEEYEYDDAYCLLYDDADANMFNVEIYVDLETYQMVRNATKSGRKLVGTLVLSDDYTLEGVDVFTYMTEEEYEIASADEQS